MQGDSPDEEHVDPHGECAHEIERLKKELGRAYRAIHGFYNAHVKGERMSEITAGYHSLTIGAARRFITEDSLDGAGYFEGKHVSVLHEVLGSYQNPQ